MARWIQVTLIWIAAAGISVTPVIVAANSPLLAWREPIYIVAGLAGVTAMSLMFFQPLLAIGFLPGLQRSRGRFLHRWVGTFLVLTLLVHLIGLWITSPPDVIDALLFVSATPFSIWGVIAMWCVFASAALVLSRKKFRLRMHVWRVAHKSLAVSAVLGTVIHALLIDGTMGDTSKIIICVSIVIVTGVVMLKLHKK